MLEVAFSSTNMLKNFLLQAWQGYSGNIYFDPIKIKRVNSANGVIETVSRSQTGSAASEKDTKKQRLQTAKPDLSRQDGSYKTWSIYGSCDTPL